MPLTALGILVFLTFYINSNKTLSSIAEIKTLHKQNIDNNPFKETLKLSKSAVNGI